MIGPNIVKTTKKIKLLRIKMKEAQDRQKSYANKRIKVIEFMVDDLIHLKIITFRGGAMTSKKGQLDPMYLG